MSKIKKLSLRKNVILKLNPMNFNTQPFVITDSHKILIGDSDDCIKDPPIKIETEKCIK